MIKNLALVVVLLGLAIPAFGQSCSPLPEPGTHYFNTPDPDVCYYSATPIPAETYYYYTGFETQGAYGCTSGTPCPYDLYTTSTDREWQFSGISIPAGDWANCVGWRIDATNALPKCYQVPPYPGECPVEKIPYTTGVVDYTLHTSGTCP